MEQPPSSLYTRMASSSSETAERRSLCHRSVITITVCNEHGVKVEVHSPPPNESEDHRLNHILDAEHIILAEIAKLSDGTRNGEQG